MNTLVWLKGRCWSNRLHASEASYAICEYPNTRNRFYGIRVVG